VLHPCGSRLLRRRARRRLRRPVGRDDIDGYSLAILCSGRNRSLAGRLSFGRSFALASRGRGAFVIADSAADDDLPGESLLARVVLDRHWVAGIDR